MSLNDKTPDSHVAYGAAIDGVTAVSTNLAIVGRYWWNLQMRLLIATGTMRLFKAHWWLFLIIGFLLLAFVFPLGVAFVVSAFCAGQMDPSSKDNFIVPLRQEDVEAVMHSSTETHVDLAVHSQFDFLDDVRLAASIHHVNYLRALKGEIGDSEFAAAALGAFDGTVQAFDLKPSDVDMYIHGAAFIFAQLKDFGRMEEVDPEWIAQVTTEAMSSSGLETIRVEAGRRAYAAEGAIQKNGHSLPTS